MTDRLETTELRAEVAQLRDIAGRLLGRMVHHVPNYEYGTCGECGSEAECKPDCAVDLLEAECAAHGITEPLETT